MNIKTLVDFANEATTTIAKHKLEFVLSPRQLSADEYPIKNLKWESVRYGDKEIDKVPDDKRGVYAFAVCKDISVLPPYCYVLYIGIAGRDSNRSLRERYKDYLNERKVLKRNRIARMIGTWHNVLRFFFAPVDNTVTNKNLKELEKKLNSSLLPPFSEGDLEAGIKQKRRAFR